MLPPANKVLWLLGFLDQIWTSKRYHFQEFTMKPEFQLIHLLCLISCLYLCAQKIFLLWCKYRNHKHLCVCWWGDVCLWSWVCVYVLTLIEVMPERWSLSARPSAQLCPLVSVSVSQFKDSTYLRGRQGGWGCICRSGDRERFRLIKMYTFMHAWT